MMRSVVILALAAALSGCGGGGFTWSVDASRPLADASLKTRCPKIPLLDRPAPMGALLEHDDMVVGMYAECAQSNAAKADYIEEMEKSRNVD